MLYSNIFKGYFPAILFLLFLSIVFECQAEESASINIYPASHQQIIKGWGGNIYPSCMDLGSDFLDQMFYNLPSQYMRVFSEFPKTADMTELSLLKYLYNKNINIILSIRLNDYVLNVKNLHTKLVDYIIYLNKNGVAIHYLSLNEPDGVKRSDFGFNEYIKLVRNIKRELLIRKVPTGFVGPDTATPNDSFIENVAVIGLLNEFDALTYHSYEYKGIGGFAKIASIADKYKKPIWINEQNPQADDKNMHSKEYALNIIRNLFYGLNNGYAEVSLFFSYAWGREGGVVLFDKRRKPKPIYYELQKLYKNVPVGSIVLRTESKLPTIAFKTNKGILLYVINEKYTTMSLKANINGVVMLKSIEPMNMGMYYIPSE